MKRFLSTVASVILILAISIFAVACGGGENPSPTTTPSTTPSSQPSAAPSVNPSAVTPGTTPSTGNTLTEAEFLNALAFTNVTGMTVNFGNILAAADANQTTVPVAEITTPASEFVVIIDGNKLSLTDPSGTAVIFESTAEALNLYVDAGEEVGAVRADVIGMIEDPILVEMVNSYLAMDYTEMILQYVAMFEDEGFDLEASVQEFVGMCEGLEYDLKAIVHAFMEGFGLEEPELEEMLADVDLEELLLILGIAPEVAEPIVNYFETNGFNLDALLDLIILNGFDLRALVEEIDTFLASKNYSLVEIVAYALESVGLYQTTLGNWMAGMMGIDAFTYETLLEMIDLEGGLTNVQWMQAAGFDTVFDYADFTYDNGEYTAELVLDQAMGISVNETLRFTDKKLSYYAITLTLEGETIGYELTFTDYNETEILVPSEAVTVTLQDLLSVIISPELRPSDYWSDMFMLDNYTSTIDITTNILGTSASAQYTYAETKENWSFSANNFMWTSGLVADFNAYGDSSNTYVNGSPDRDAEAIPLTYASSIFQICAFFEEDFVQTGANSYLAETLTDFSTITGGGYQMTIEDLAVTITDGYVSSISYTALIDMNGINVTEVWVYTITNVNETVIPIPSYAR